MTETDETVDVVDPAMPEQDHGPASSESPPEASAQDDLQDDPQASVEDSPEPTPDDASDDVEGVTPDPDEPGHGPADDLDDLLGLAGAKDAGDPADDRGEPAEESDDEADAVPDVAAEAEAAPVRRRRPVSMDDVRDRRDLIRLAGDWYVVHTYSGYEQRVKDNLTNRIEALAAEDRIFELVIPTEEVTEFKKGKKQVSEKKFLPGYVLIRMELDDETWNIVRHTPAVTGFVGATASKPVPLSLREVAATLKIPDRLEEPVEGEPVVVEAKPQVREIDLEEGETVRVTTGPFADFTGTIAEINLDQAKLRVMVSVFGRETPLEMPFDQVAKVT